MGGGYGIHQFSLVEGSSRCYYEGIAIEHAMRLRDQTGLHSMHNKGVTGYRGWINKLVISC